MGENGMIRLKELRELHNESQKDIAKLCKVSKQTVLNRENGIHEPKIDILILLADHYRVTVDYLIGHNINVENKAKMIDDLNNEFSKVVDRYWAIFDSKNR